MSPRKQRVYHQCKMGLMDIINKCGSAQEQTKFLTELIRNLKEEHRLKSESFQSIFDLLKSLDESSAKSLETLFYYNVTDQDEYNHQAQIVTREYKMGKLDPSNQFDRVNKVGYFHRIKPTKEILDRSRRSRKK